MRIIIDGSEEKIKTCPKCGTMFAYQKVDAYTTFFGEERVVCPVCWETLKTSIFDKKVKK